MAFDIRAKRERELHSGHLRVYRQFMPVIGQHDRLTRTRVSLVEVYVPKQKFGDLEEAENACVGDSEAANSVKAT